jgi:large subunit ribosomal protein L32
MAVQKRRQSHGRSARRRAQWMASVKVPNVTSCPDCGEPKAAHRVCLKCGSYKGQKVVEVQTNEEQS